MNSPQPTAHGVDFSRVFDIISYQAHKYPNQKALNFFHHGQWRSLSIEVIQQRVDALSAWFLGQGFKPGDKVMLVPVMGTPEWMLLDFACQQIGVVVVPVHPTSRAEEFSLILSETESTLCITTNLVLKEKFEAVAANAGLNLTIYHCEPDLPGYFEPLQRRAPDKNLEADLAKRREAVQEEDVFAILYTSGSSGIPKGVMLTHRNVIHNIKSILALLPLEPGQRALSFLPFSHIFERTTCYAYIAFGVSLYFSYSKESFAQDFKSVRPVFCTSVPRVLEKMYDFLEEQLVHQNILKKKLTRWAMAVGKQYQNTERSLGWLAVQLFAARLLVLKKWRNGLGGGIRYIAVGAAALRPEIGKLFSASGIHIVEGYGMTETSPIISMNRFEPGQNRFGTVGLVLPGIEVKLDQLNENQEGEILVRGPNVTSGYYKHPELTKEAFTEDGWFRTGDVGKWEHLRFLKITDRKKDIFKTSSGKYIAPLPLQNHFCASPFIQRCLIIGFQRPYVTSLIVPHFSIVESWCEQEGIHWTSPPFMVHNIKVRALFQREIDRLNERLPNHERVRNFVLCHEEWTTENGEITTTLKPVRHLLVEHYKNEIDKMYTN